MRIFTIICTTILLAGCGQKVILLDNQKPPKPESKISLPGSVVHYFEHAKPGDTGQKSWRIHNDGNATLELRLKEKSCSCTDINLSNKDTVHVEPGKYFDINVKWKVQNAEKHFSGVKIFSNDPGHAEFALMIEGTVEISAERKREMAERELQFKKAQNLKRK